MSFLLSFLLIFMGPLGPPSGSPVAAAPVPGVAAAPLSPFAWPLGPPWVVRPFDPPPAPWLAGHRGADLGGPAGASVLAAGAGTVVFAGSVAGRGVVSVAHPGGLRTTYEPVFPLVSAGDVVVAGGTIATLAAGHPGCRVAACLHWGAKRGTDYVDPLALLGVRRVRLLPLPAG